MRVRGSGGGEEAAQRAPTGRCAQGTALRCPPSWTGPGRLEPAGDGAVLSPTAAVPGALRDPDGAGGAPGAGSLSWGWREAGGASGCGAFQAARCEGPRSPLFVPEPRTPWFLQPADPSPLRACWPRDL